MSDLKKKLIVRSSKMGMRELDILVGGFARAQIDQLTEPELQVFEELLNNPDQEILAWIQGIAPVPAEFAVIVTKIQQHIG